MPFARTISDIPNNAHWGPKPDGAYLCIRKVIIPICAVGIVKDVGVWHSTDTVPWAEIEVEFLRELDVEAMAKLSMLGQDPSTLVDCSSVIPG